MDGKNPIDIRVSIAPTFYGENAVLRLLADRDEKFSLETLGFYPEDAAKIKEAMKRTHGMILSTGPTGSGKTTSLYTILKILHTKEVAITTIEDPIEYAIEGINQIQVNARAGLTFANGLRSLLRQDPDMIMVGEIRDPETAALAVNAALTGHLVLSTLHTNDAATTLPRLLDLGVAPYLITSTVHLVIGQRLLRKICIHCKKEHTLSPEEAASFKKISGIARLDLKKIWKGAGCDQCNGSGYRGRIGIYEIIIVDETIRKAMLAQKSASDIKMLAVERGMTTMAEDGLRKITDGITTMEEVLRVIYE